MERGNILIRMGTWCIGVGGFFTILGLRRKHGYSYEEALTEFYSGLITTANQRLDEQLCE